MKRIEKKPEIGTAILVAMSFGIGAFVVVGVAGGLVIALASGIL